MPFFLALQKNRRIFVGVRIKPPDFSREAAQECSPRRKPWVRSGKGTKPRRGERVVPTRTLQPGGSPFVVREISHATIQPDNIALERPGHGKRESRSSPCRLLRLFFKVRYLGCFFFFWGFACKIADAKRLKFAVSSRFRKTRYLTE